MSLRRCSFIHFRSLCLGAPAVALLLAANAFVRADEKPVAAEADIIVAKEDDGEAAVELVQETAADAAPTYGSPVTQRMRIGARVEAKGGNVQNILIMVAVPLDCPEQRVTVVEEEYSDNSGTVEFRTLPDVKLAIPGAKQMLISIPVLPARQTATATVTYDIQTDHVYAPKETATLQIPKRPSRDIKPFVKSSPFIDVNDRKIRDAIKEALEMRVTKGTAGSSVVDSSGNNIEQAAATAAAAAAVAANAKDDEDDTRAAKIAQAKLEKKKEKEEEPKEDPAVLAEKIAKLTDWQKVEALYDFVRTKVKYRNGAEDMPAVKALKDGEADCYGMSALFVAMCRTMKVPARMVWVDNHQYAEFYLESEAGKGHWYPAQLAGTRAFGEMPLPMVIFQKGDSFTVPERRRERLRYATDYTTLSASAKHKPRVVYVREPL